MECKKENLKQHIKKYYDYISTMDIALINKEDSYGCTVKECKEIHDELYEWN
jgi:hypothetical protein